MLATCPGPLEALYDGYVWMRRYPGGAAEVRRESGVQRLRFADLEEDVALIERARDAKQLMQRDPQAAPPHL